jgi:hypothetical protein
MENPSLSPDEWMNAPDGEVNKIVSLNDNYAPAEHLRGRAIFLVQNYLEEKALDTEPELQKIYQKIP